MRTITIPPITAPATIPPIGVEDEGVGGTVEDVDGRDLNQQRHMVGVKPWWSLKSESKS